jgi:DNA-binding beta-propeller fold protein YncE
LVPDPSGKRLYIDNFQSSRISILDVAKREIVDSLIVQNGPSMMTFWPGHNVLVVSCFYTDRVLFVDLSTKQIVKSISVDSNPTSLEFSKDGKELLVLCGGESSLDVIDVEQGIVRERHKMLFGAYAFHEVTTD